MKENSKIVVSGTFSTGKTSLVKALNLITGIPALHSKSITQLQKVYFPERQVHAFSPFEYAQLNLWRFCEQLQSEQNMKCGFWADDFLLHHYIYGVVRLDAYWSLNKSSISKAVQKLTLLPQKRPISFFYDQIGRVFIQYALNNYHSVIHLPLEYHAAGEDAHLYDERIRKNCDALLIKTIEKIGINYFIITGNLEQRLEKIIKIFGLKPIMSVKEALMAVDEAVRQGKTN